VWSVAGLGLLSWNTSEEGIGRLDKIGVLHNMDSGGDRRRAPHKVSREEDQYRSMEEKHQQQQQQEQQQQQQQQQQTLLLSNHERSRRQLIAKSKDDSPPMSPNGRLRTVANKYAIGRIVGSGAFCKVYEGADLTNQEIVGIKLEDSRTDNAQLHHESRWYSILKGGKGVPNMRWFGREHDYNVLVLDLLGPNLLHLFQVCNQRFSLKTVIMLAYQMIDRVEYVHSRGLVHRDLKPDNFLMGCGRQGNQVFIIDFGLAKEYIDPNTRKHIPYRDKKSFTGTARYASLNQHFGIEHSRRDDIESIGYILMYFLRGNLPWQGVQRYTPDHRQHEHLHNKIKVNTSIEELCEGYPLEFAAFLHHARSLSFSQEPDYSYLRRLFRDLFIEKGFQLDHVYDWTVNHQPHNVNSSKTTTTTTTTKTTATQEQLPKRPETIAATRRPDLTKRPNPSSYMGHVQYTPPLSNPEFRHKVPVIAAN
jgi:casein kinase 1